MVSYWKSEAISKTTWDLISKFLIHKTPLQQTRHHKNGHGDIMNFLKMIDLFGMIKWPAKRESKVHELNHLVHENSQFSMLKRKYT